MCENGILKELFRYTGHSEIDQLSKEIYDSTTKNLDFFIDDAIEMYLLSHNWDVFQSGCVTILRKDDVLIALQSCQNLMAFANTYTPLLEQGGDPTAIEWLSFDICGDSSLDWQYFPSFLFQNLNIPELDLLDLLQIIQQFINK